MSEVKRTKLFSVYDVETGDRSISFNVINTDGSGRACSFKGQHLTPAILIPTVGGMVPHLTSDIWEEPGQFENVFVSVPVSDLHAFVAFKKNAHWCLNQRESVFIIATWRSCSDARPERKISENLKDLELLCQQNESVLQPNLWVCPGDPVPETTGSNRNTLAIERSAKWAALSSSSSRLAYVVGRDQKGASISAKKASDVLKGKGGYFIDVAPRSTYSEILLDLSVELPRIVSASCAGPHQVLKLVQSGFDLIETCYPQILAKTGFASVYSIEGANEWGPLMKINVRSSRFLVDTGPLVASCNCFTCRNHSRAYLRHLLETREMLGETLIFAHNLKMMISLVETARSKILEGSLSSWMESWFAKYNMGSGGRECCVAYTLAKSPLVSKVFVCPGNAGTADSGKISNVASGSDNESILKVAKEVKPDLVFIGPEAPLVSGLADELISIGFRCFGPTKSASELEASKAFSKEFFSRHNLPTASYKTFTNSEEAKKYVKEVDWVNSPVVVKASGLCAGKGVFIPDDAESAIEAVKTIMDDSSFGTEAGKEVVIEERLEGQEVSVLAFCDGITSRCMPAAQDHKRVGDGDTGLNTGGMGAYAPAPCVTKELDIEIQDIVQRTLEGLRSENRNFIGVLFAGLMLTKSGPKLLEYNVRMGDPETEVVLPLLKTDLFEICNACIDGKLSELQVEWEPNRNAATVVIAAKGYPMSYKTDMQITGFEDVPPSVTVFHAGTKVKDSKVVATGGRILTVTGVGSTLQDAVNAAYEGVTKIKFNPTDSTHYRKDIAHRALNIDGLANKKGKF